MNDKFFLDTNVCIYAFDFGSKKKEKALDLIIGNQATVSNYSLYDALIISSALEANCSILYSEDMHHGHCIDKRLKIVNPFLY